MRELFEKLVKDKEDIVTETVTEVKMLVPLTFRLVDGKCEDSETQSLYEFLSERDDVKELEKREEIEDDYSNIG